MFDQAEIDALLSSVEAQNAGFDDDSAIQIFSRFRRESEPIELSEYDFRRPERIRKEELHAMEVLHEAFARNLSALLTPFLRTMTEVTLAQVEQMTFAEFVTAMPNPTAFAMLHSPGLDGPLGFEISPLIVYPMIDRLLGGGASGDLFIPKRPLTAIESRLVKMVLAKAALGLSEAWAELLGSGFTLGELETNPHLAIFAAPNEIVLAARFDVRMQKRGGGMALCIPIREIEGLLRVLSDRAGQGATVANQARCRQSQTGSEPSGLNPRVPSPTSNRDAIAARLARAQVNVSAVLAETSITVREMQGLEVGDIIATATPATEPATIAIEGRPKFRATLGQSRGKRAVEIN